MKNQATPARILAAALLVTAVATHSRACPDATSLSTCNAVSAKITSSQYSDAIATIEKVEESAQTLAQAAHGAGLTLALANGAMPNHPGARAPHSAPRLEQAAITLVASLTKAVFVCLFADASGVDMADPAIEPSQPPVTAHDVCVTA